jgi:hypothetical protein
MTGGLGDAHGMRLRARRLRSSQRQSSRMARASRSASRTSLQCALTPAGSSRRSAKTGCPPHPILSVKRQRPPRRSRVAKSFFENMFRRPGSSARHAVRNGPGAASPGVHVRSVTETPDPLSLSPQPAHLDGSGALLTSSRPY